MIALDMNSVEIQTLKPSGLACLCVYTCPPLEGTRTGSILLPLQHRFFLAPVVGPWLWHGGCLHAYHGMVSCCFRSSERYAPILPQPQSLWIFPQFSILFGFPTRSCTINSCRTTKDSADGITIQQNYFEKAKTICPWPLTTNSSFFDILPP